MTPVLVTGGAGFVGSHLCQALLAQGQPVLCVDDCSSGRVSNLAPLRADPRRVGAPHPIRIIVGVVDSDLQPEGDQRGQNRAGRAEPLLVNRDTGTRQHWCDGCGQRPQTRALDPLGDTRHVQFPLGSAGRFQR